MAMLNVYGLNQGHIHVRFSNMGNIEISHPNFSLIENHASGPSIYLVQPIN
jgi:hypothetical protein